MKMTAPMEVGLTVKDLSRMLGFYCKAFGLSVESDITVPAVKAQQAGLSTGAYRVVRLQTPWGERIKLLAPELPPSNMPAPNGHILDQHASSYLTFIVEDLDTVMADAIDAGAVPMTGDKPVEVRPGTFLTFVRDPEGHMVEIVEYADIIEYRNDLVAAGQ